MRNRLCRGIFFSLLAVAPLAAAAQPADGPADGPADVPSNVPADSPAALPADDVAALVARLGGADPAARVTADVRLRNLPGAALPALEAQAKRADLPPAARAPLDTALSVVRARARILTRDGQEWEQNYQSAVAAYERAGRRDPRWDDAVRAGVRLYTKPRSFREAGETDQAVFDALRKATAAGCDDPFVQYFAARAELQLRGRDRDAALRRFFDAALALQETQYPADRKLFAAAAFIRESKVPDPRAADAVVRSLPAAFATGDGGGEGGGGARSGAQWCDVAVEAYEALTVVRRDRQAAFEEVYVHYGKARPADDPWPHVFRGYRYTKYAWEARGSGFAPTVTDEGWRLFRERLAVADGELRRAWELDETLARSATLMLTVEMGLRGDRQEMEKWFRRAMSADPDNATACRYKLQFLLPRWHGSHEQMLAFGRECLAGQNWAGGLPLVLASAHEQIAAEAADPAAYFALPQVWQDVRAVHDAYLKVYPEAPRAGWHRNKLARWACECGRWDEALDLFARIGDSPDLTVFRSRALYDYYRKKAGRLSGAVRQASAAPLGA